MGLRCQGLVGRAGVGAGGWASCGASGWASCGASCGGGGGRMAGAATSGGCGPDCCISGVGVVSWLLDVSGMSRSSVGRLVSIVLTLPDDAAAPRRCNPPCLSRVFPTLRICTWLFALAIAFGSGPSDWMALGLAIVLVCWGLTGVHCRFLWHRRSKRVSPRAHLSPNRPRAGTVRGCAGL